MKLAIINGPNLQALGSREPEIYGSLSFEDFFKELQTVYEETELQYFQSNIEGELIDRLYSCDADFDGIVFNAAGYTHTSVAIADAVASIKTEVIEVHISNVYAREDYRHVSLMAKHCKGVIAGFGLQSYELAIQSFLSN